MTFYKVQKVVFELISRMYIPFIIALLHVVAKYDGTAECVERHTSNETLKNIFDRKTFIRNSFRGQAINLTDFFDRERLSIVII